MLSARAHANADDPRVFVFNEDYHDADALAAHGEPEHFKRLVHDRGIPLLEDRFRTYPTPLRA